jgi:hypothetical protein
MRFVPGIELESDAFATFPLCDLCVFFVLLCEILIGIVMQSSEKKTQSFAKGFVL